MQWFSRMSAHPPTHAHTKNVCLIILSVSAFHVNAKITGIPHKYAVFGGFDMQGRYHHALRIRKTIKAGRLEKSFFIQIYESGMFSSHFS
jgi:hypothetical protein